MPQSSACLHVHLIVGTKDRMAALTDDLRSRLYEYIGGTLRVAHCKLVATGGTVDHIHLLCSLDREMSVADAARLIKSNSSKWVHQTFPAQRVFAWQSGYAAFAVSLSNVASVKRYLARQAEHHRTVSFQDEFIAFLRRNQIEFDAHYIWDSS